LCDLHRIIEILAQLGAGGAGAKQGDFAGLGSTQGFAEGDGFSFASDGQSRRPGRTSPWIAIGGV